MTSLKEAVPPTGTFVRPNGSRGIPRTSLTFTNCRLDSALCQQ